ncbi:hypothetical protein [Loktanella sp. M215]|uniref:hypothetical protein n=1 Tax=Loktanella sp. M215 TaxID=2675431 RepID=UPI001F29BD3C|nr:hypothetical protein [Loktanella sp. M215]MCF7697815.1 hypothetical protein [Loktanella sp. M215]
MATQTTDDVIVTPRAVPPGGFAICGAVLLAAGFLTYIASVVFGSPPLATVAAALILVFILMNLGRASLIVRSFAIVAGLIAVWGLAAHSLTIPDLTVAGGRVSFLTSILIALIFLRLVAARDPAFQAAGAFLANQPPSRRYVSLGIGGNLFGVLLNLGGLGLLIEMTLAGQRRLESQSAVSPAVHDVRERRIVTAIVRGFATIAFWSPFGIALNTLLLIFTEVHWRDAAPWGLGFAALFLIVGGLMDIIERRLFPIFPKPVAVPPAPGDGLGLLAVLGHLVGLALLVITGDHLLPFSFQQVLVGVVPVYAVIWSVIRSGARGPVQLIRDFTANAPRYVNEIGVFALAGLIGALLVALVPQHALDPVLGAIVAWGGPVALALALAWVTLLAAMLGLHPIISVVILAEFMVRTPLISQQTALLSLLTGWTLTVCLAPLATTATYVGAILDRSTLTVSLRWNGLFGAITLALASGILVLGITGGWF